MKYVTTIADREYEIEIIDERTVRVGGRLLHVDFESVSGQPVYSLLVDGNSYEAYVHPAEDGWQVLLRGRLYPAQIEDERERRLRAAAGAAVAETGEFQLRAPMPGLVVSIPVSPGQAVKRGDVLLILESMKMQNELKSPRDGTVGRIRVKPTESVEQKQTLLTLL
jgi:biotin carboxyl carrier protein